MRSITLQSIDKWNSQEGKSAYACLCLSFACVSDRNICFAIFFFLSSFRLNLIFCIQITFRDHLLISIMNGNNMAD